MRFACLLLLAVAPQVGRTPVTPPVERAVVVREGGAVEAWRRAHVAGCEVCGLHATADWRLRDWLCAFEHEPDSFDAAARLRDALPGLIAAAEEPRRVANAWLAFARSEWGVGRRAAALDAYARAVAIDGASLRYAYPEPECWEDRLAGTPPEARAARRFERALDRGWGDPAGPIDAAARTMAARTVVPALLERGEFARALELERTYDAISTGCFAAWWDELAQERRIAEALWGLGRRDEALAALGEPWLDLRCDTADGLDTLRDLARWSLELSVADALEARLVDDARTFTKDRLRPAGERLPRLFRPEVAAWLRTELALARAERDGGTVGVFELLRATPPERERVGPEPTESVWAFRRTHTAPWRVLDRPDAGAVARAALAEGRDDWATWLLVRSDAPDAAALCDDAAFAALLDGDLGAAGAWVQELERRRTPDAEARLRRIAAGPTALAPVAARRLAEGPVRGAW